jgi:DsbC/DsbD-like thiol-disulfide interchange protein
MVKATFNSLLVAVVFVPELVLGASAKVAADHVTVELVSEATAAAPGTRTWLGLKFTHEPHWHTYWKNPGDSGLPTRLEWQLPPGFRAGEIVWPAPRRFDLGDIFNFGYDGTMLLMVPIDVPANAAKSASLNVNARWLICNDVCIPGRASLGIEVPIAKQSAANAAAAALFAKSRSTVPVSADARGAITTNGDRIRVEFDSTALPKDGTFDYFPSLPKLFTNAPFKVTQEGNRTVLTGVRSEYFESAPPSLPLVVTRNNGAQAWVFDLPWVSGARSSASN